MKTRTRVILTTIVAFVLLLAAVAAGLNAVFTVTLVETSFITCSASGEAEAAELKETLDKFVGKSTTFLKLKDIRAAVEKYPNFRVKTLEKHFPSTVIVSIVEREETFAIAREDGGYAILDEEGIYLYDKAENTNRVAGENILLEGFKLELNENEPAQGVYFEELLSVISAFRETLVSVRANVVSVKLESPLSNVPRYDSFLIQMHEGVKIDFVNPSFKTAEKAVTAIEYYYHSLGDEPRLFGLITVSDNNETGEILLSYARDEDLVG